MPNTSKDVDIYQGIIIDFSNTIISLVNVGLGFQTITCQVIPLDAPKKQKSDMPKDLINLNNKAVTLYMIDSPRGKRLTNIWINDMNSFINDVLITEGLTVLFI